MSRDFIVYLGLILIGVFPYYLFKSQKLKDYYIFLSVVFGLLILYKWHILRSFQIYNLFEIIGLIGSIFTLRLSYKTHNLKKLSYYFLFMNSVSFFVLPFNIFLFYFGSVFLGAFLLYILGVYMEHMYESANFDILKGFALKTPMFGLILRLDLLVLGAYPPFSTFFYLFMGLLIKSPMNIWSAERWIIILYLFFANFILAFRIMKNTIFGKPNENILYKDLDISKMILPSLILLILIVLGFYGFLEVL